MAKKILHFFPNFTFKTKIKVFVLDPKAGLFWRRSHSQKNEKSGEKITPDKIPNRQ